MASLQTRAGGPLPKPKPGGRSFLTTPGQDIERARADAPWSTSARKTRCCGTCPHDLRLTWSYRVAPAPGPGKPNYRRLYRPHDPLTFAPTIPQLGARYLCASGRATCLHWPPSRAPCPERCGSTAFSASLTQIPWHHPLALRPQHLQIPQRPRE